MAAIAETAAARAAAAAAGGANPLKTIVDAAERARAEGKNAQQVVDEAKAAKDLMLSSIAANVRISNIIGAPIPRYEDGDPGGSDFYESGVYNVFRPALLYCYHVLNAPYENRRVIYEWMETTLTLTDAGGNRIADFAVTKNLIPQAQAGESNLDWYQRWFDMLFPREEQPNRTTNQPRLIIQGGEAVNFYTQYKNENVRTHDMDTRVVIGNHFTYVKRVADVEEGMRYRMHRFRLFAALSIMIILRDHARSIDTNAAYRFASAFIPEWTDNGVRSDFSFNGAGMNLVDFLTSYDIDDDRWIECLIQINVGVSLLDGRTIRAGVVDLFIPYKRPPGQGAHNFGQSDDIHSYFGTDQIASLQLTAPVHESGVVPSVILPLIITPTTPVVGGKTVNVTLVPHGFILYDTIRMLLTSIELDNKGGIATKTRKYKQKLASLLGTLTDVNVSQAIFNYCASKVSAIPELREVLTGGQRGGRTAIDTLVQPQLVTKMDSKPQVAQVLSQMSTATKAPQMSKPTTPIVVVPAVEEDPEIAAARAFSRKLWNNEIDISTLDETTLTSTEKRGYMHYLGIMDPFFKEYQLPMPRASPLVFGKPAPAQQSGGRRTLYG